MDPAAGPRWPRVILKMSGEALASAASDETIDNSTVDRIAAEIAAARSQLGVEIGVVIGGGNIWRGATGEAEGMDRASSDHMGMLGTVINALALQDALERHGQPTRVQSAIDMAAVCVSPTSGAGPSATSRRAGSWCSPRAWAGRSSPPTPPPPCGPPRSGPGRC